MQQTITHNDVALINKGLRATGAKIALESSSFQSQAITCLFINNRDGSLRWIWPAGMQQPAFLRFYYAGGIKARLFSTLVKTCFTLRCPRMAAHGSVTLYLNEAGASVIRNGKEWALFTGTVGANRKLIFWQQNEEAGSTFTKLPVTGAAAINIQKERAALTHEMPAGIIVPAALDNRHAFIQPDIYTGKKTESVRYIGQLPVKAFQAWLSHDLGKKEVSSLGWMTALKKESPAGNNKDSRVSPMLLRNLELLVSDFRNNTSLTTATAHGDFTSWNIRKSDDSLLMIDWELSRPDMPALYDLFHFIYQGSILVDRKPFAAIRQETDQLLAMPEWQDFLTTHKIDARRAEQLYLIYTVSYYLDIYKQQDQWHTQVSWLLQTWNEALGYWVREEGLLGQRQTVLRDIASFLHDKPYAAMKQTIPDITELPLTSDLDLCMPRETRDSLLGYLRAHSAVASLRVSHLSFMSRATAILLDGSLIHIDCIREIRRKNLVFMNATRVWSRSVANKNGIKIPSLCDDLKYTWLFYLLNKASVPEHYQQHYLKHPKALQAIFALSYGLRGRENREVLNYCQAHHMHILNLLSKHKVNKGLKKAIHTVQYGLDTLLSLIPRKGCIVTFSGVDGAGKSTVIETIRKRVEKELRLPVVVLRHRPSILPILSAWKHGKKEAEQIAATTMPHQGKNNSRLSSIIRFAYYYTDYLIGQLYVQCRYVLRGYVVLYDRYYFDFINDSKRSNIMLPPSFTTWWYRFLIKPRFNFFLYAPAQVILARKQEMDEQRIKQLTDQYISLFDRLGKRRKQQYIPVCNINLDATLNQVFDHIKTKRA